MSEHAFIALVSVEVEDEVALKAATMIDTGTDIHTRDEPNDAIGYILNQALLEAMRSSGLRPKAISISVRRADGDEYPAHTVPAWPVGGDPMGRR